MGRQRKVGKFEGDIGAISQVLNPSSRKLRSSPKKTKPFSREMHLKNPIFSRGMKFKNSKPG
jgi:hypothetical protein